MLVGETLWLYLKYIFVEPHKIYFCGDGSQGTYEEAQFILTLRSQ